MGVSQPDGTYLMSSPFALPVGASSTSDITCDEAVTAGDALKALRIIAALDTSTACSTGDADNNASVNIADALYIRKVAVGLLHP